MAEKNNQENEALETTEFVENETAAVEAAEAVSEVPADKEDKTVGAEDEVTEIEEAVEDEVPEVEEAVEDEVTEVEEAVEDEVTEVEEAVEDEVPEVEEAVEDEVPEVEEAVEDEVPEVEEAVEDEVPEVEEAVEDEADEVEEAVEDEAVEVEEAVEDEAAEVEEAVEDEVPEVEEAVEDEVPEVEEAVEDEVPEVEEAVEDEAAEVEEAVEDEVTEVEEAVEDEVTEVEEAAEDEDEVSEVEEDADIEDDEAEASENDDVDDSDDEIGVDEDDYLDYDEDEVRPKKIVSGKAAVVTMLLTFLGSVLVIVGAFLFATRFQRSMDVTFVSYTDRFNSCRTNDFSYGEMLGIGTVSYSDKEASLSKEDIKALKSGKTITKFDGMVNITSKVRFGKVVSLDIGFNPSINDTSNPTGYFALLAGNALSGLIPGIETSDNGFMAAYTIINYSVPTYDNVNLYCYRTEDMSFYLDYSKASETQQLNDLVLHVESTTPHYLDDSVIDTSWLPWKKEPVSESDAMYDDDTAYEDDGEEASPSDF